MKVLAGVRNLMNLPSHLAAVGQAREPSIEDLLGRNPVAGELDTIRPALAGRRVLVTGAGGSIGSEICRQISGLKPDLLVLLDHDETHLHDTASTISEPCVQALVDITDRTAVFEAFNRSPPGIVPHATAHKHVPVLETYPVEAVNTNVFGTLNVVEASVSLRGTVRSDFDRQSGAANECHGCVKEPCRTGRAGELTEGRCLLCGSLRKCARQPRQCHSDVRSTDRKWRPRDGHQPPHHPVLYERRRGSPARIAVCDAFPGWRDLHVGHGTACSDYGSGTTHDSPVGLPSWSRHPYRDHGQTPW